MRIDQKILNQYYDNLKSTITSKVIKSLQGIKDTLSGDDSGLINAWDEICVQLQGKESFYWNVYEEEIERTIRGYVEELQLHEKSLLWLYTENGDVFYENNTTEDAVYNIDDIVNHIKINFIFATAVDYSNKRIKKYLGF